jgi:hypothetical protein
MAAWEEKKAMPQKQPAAHGWRLRLCVALVLFPTPSNPTASLAQGLQRVAVLLPILPGERERWAQPRPEPVTLDLADWTMWSSPPDTSLPNQRIVRFSHGTCNVQLTRFWDRALTDGGPMSLKGSRPVTVAGRQIELHTTSFFGGPREVQLLWLEGKGYDVEYIVRLHFEHCSDDAVEEVLRRVEVHW